MGFGFLARPVEAQGWLIAFVYIWQPFPTTLCFSICVAFTAVSTLPLAKKHVFLSPSCLTVPIFQRSAIFVGIVDLDAEGSLSICMSFGDS